MCSSVICLFISFTDFSITLFDLFLTVLRFCMLQIPPLLSLVQTFFTFWYLLVILFIESFAIQILLIFIYSNMTILSYLASEFLILVRKFSSTHRLYSLLYFLEIFFGLSFTLKSTLFILYILTDPWLILLWVLIWLIQVVLDLPHSQISRAPGEFLCPTHLPPLAHSHTLFTANTIIHQALSAVQITLLQVVKSPLCQYNHDSLGTQIVV